MHHASSESSTARLPLSGTAPQNFPQILNLLVHVVQHLPHGIDFHFAALESFQRETNREVLGKLHDYGLIRFRIWRLRGQARECLLQHVLCAPGQLRHLLLEHSRRSHAALTCADATETRQRAQNRVNLFLARLTASAPAPSGASPAAECPRDAVGSSQARHDIGHLHASTATAGPEAPNRNRCAAGSTSADTHSSTHAPRAATVAKSDTGTRSAAGA